MYIQSKEENHIARLPICPLKVLTSQIHFKNSVHLMAGCRRLRS